MVIIGSKPFLKKGWKDGKKSQAQEDLKKIKIKIETILNIPEHIALECVDVWFQDEANLDNKTRQHAYGQKKQLAQEP